MLFKIVWLKLLSTFWQFRLGLIDAYYTIGSKNNKLPDFLIIGVPKGGTTYLYHLLNQHTQIEMSRRKEIHFFDRHYHRGLRYYKSFFPSAVKGVKTGEASVNYFYSEKVKNRIAQDLPNCKLILLLRDPIDRAYSHFQMNKKDMIEKSFDQYVTSDGFESNKYRYLEKGLYAEYLPIWQSFLERGNLLILKSEELFSDTNNVISKVHQYLDLKPEPTKSLTNKNSGNYEKMSSQTRQKLETYYQKDQEILRSLIGNE